MKYPVGTFKQESVPHVSLRFSFPLPASSGKFQPENLILKLVSDHTTPKFPGRSKWKTSLEGISQPRQDSTDKPPLT